jgi:hypothetical protein
MKALILAIAVSLGIDGNLAVSLALVENARLDPEAVSAVNTNGTFDLGLLQLNSAYIGEFAARYWDKEEPFDWKKAEHNVYVGLRHLRYLLDVPQWNTWQALVAWNAGETALMRGTPPERSIVFANTVYTALEKAKAQNKKEAADDR